MLSLTTDEKIDKLINISESITSTQMSNIQLLTAHVI